MHTLFSLGELFISDFLKEGEEPRGEKVEMKLLMDNDGIVRLEKSAPNNEMWGKYWYRSSVNGLMRRQLKNVVDSITNVYKLERHDLWIDLAANDGYLLSCVPENLIRVGIDPAEDSFRLECERHADLVIQDYFSAGVFKKSKFGNIKAKVITTISMFYDLDEPEKFLKDVHEVLDDDGIFVVQLSHSGLMISQMAWDNICHEHRRYYCLFNIKKLFEKCGFKIMDCELNDTNAGSFRVYAMKEKGNVNKFSSQPYRDVCNFRIESIIRQEMAMKMNDPKTWIDFYDRINKLKDQTISFIKSEISKGKTIYGYGASTKGSSLAQYYNLDSTMITAIAERSPYKYGLRTVGTNIPIISEDEMRKAKPDYLFVFPWHFIGDFIEREQELLKSGTKFIVPCPRFEIIGL